MSRSGWWSQPALPSWAQDLVERTSAAAENVPGALALATRFGAELPLPGAGSTAQRWQVLAAVAAADLTVARVLEAHSDALAILAEAADAAGSDQADAGGSGGVFAAGSRGVFAASSGGVFAASSWGVFAAEGPGVSLNATHKSTDDDETWALTGTKPWCSLGGVLERGLVTAHVEGGRRLFAVDLRSAQVRADPPSAWAARGLREVTSTALHFDDAPATPVGAVDWYLHRPGFAWGGIGVAACWFGAAAALAESLRAATARSGGELHRLHLGAVDVALFSAHAVLVAAAASVDAGCAGGPDGALLALRVRSAVAAAAEETLTRVGHALGPGPLAFDAVHARRVADLQIYVRQHHAERDLAALGSLVAPSEPPAPPTGPA